MKRKAISCLLVLASVLTMTPSIPTLAAENQAGETMVNETLADENQADKTLADETQTGGTSTDGLQDTNASGSKAAVVKYDQASSFTVTIPKSIVLDSNKAATYNVKVKGDVLGNEIITVVPDATVTLNDANGKDPVTGNIAQGKTEFSSTEVNQIDGTKTNGNIAADDLTSGDWSGNFTFSINTNQIGDGVSLTNSNLDTYQIDTVGDVVIPEYVTDEDNTRHAVTSISDYTFRDCNEMTSVTIADSVTEIGTGAFANCSKLSRAAVPNSVRSIGNSAFDGCPSLSSISYKGNEYDLSNIEPAFVENGVSVGSHAFEHSYSEPVYTWSEDNSTCTVTKTCSECHDIITETADVNTKTTDSTCTDEGLNTYTAAFKNSGFKTQTKTSKISAKGHKSVSANNAVAATCTTDGKESDTVCSVCGVTLATGKTIMKTRHKYGNPTYTWSNDGKTCVAKRVCANNGTHIETENATITNKVKTAATCTVKGTTTYTATFKNTAFKTQTKDIQNIAALGHTPVNGYCTRCNEKVAGLYDASGAMLCSWEDSGIDITTDRYGGGAYLRDDKTCYNVINNKYKTTTRIVLPDTITRIAAGAFDTCTTLTQIDLPNNLVSIGNSAFNGCKGLKSVNMPNSVTQIDVYAFRDCTNLASVILSNKLSDIKRGTFYNCSALTNIGIPESVTSIGDEAFYECSSLRGISIPGNVTTFGSYIFKNCTALNSVIMYNGITTIGNGMFYGCSDLSQVILQETITSIGSEAFRYCRRLNTVSIPSSVKEIGNSAFRGCTSLKNITLPKNVIELGDSAFSDCNSLTSVTILGNIPSIKSNTFYMCFSLTSVTIPDSVTQIKNNAFEWCQSLTSITIPKGVTTIGNSAFSNCKSLNSASFKTTSGWTVVNEDLGKRANINSSNLTNTSTAATYLTSTYKDYRWNRT